MAPRWGGLRPEPYKLSPPDADRDMIVQEGTAWERPGGLRLLDRLGNAIEAGMESLSPVDGLRYVDSSGTDVGYVPTWVGAEEIVPGTGLRALSNMPGVRTVGDMTGGSASLKDRGLALGDRRKAVAEAIREAQKPKVPEPEPEPHPLLTGIAKAEKVKAELEAAGGHWSMTAKERHDFSHSHVFVHDSGHKQDSGSWKTFDRTGVEWITHGRDEERGRMDKHLRDDLENQIKVHEEVVAIHGQRDPKIAVLHQQKVDKAKQGLEYLETHTDEEFAADLVKALRIWYDDEDNDVVVQIPAGEIFGKFLEEGYKTTHEVESNHSNEDIRADYEVMQGVPLNASESVRPASGHVVSGARKRWLTDQMSDDNGNFKVSDDRLFHPDASPEHSQEFATSTEGTTTVYGRVQLIMNDDVKERTKTGAGDTLNSSVRAMPMTGATDEDLLDAFLASDGGKGSHTAGEKLKRSLELVIDGPGENLHTIGAGADNPYGLGGEAYMETLIFGSFDIADVKEIKIPEDFWRASAGASEASSLPTADQGWHNSHTDQATAMVMENLMATVRTGDIEGVEPEVLDLIRSALVENAEAVKDNLIRSEVDRRLQEIASMKKRAAILETIRAKNKEIKVSFTNSVGVDFDNPSIYPEAADNPGMTVEQIMKDRLVKALNSLSEMVKSWEPPVERVPTPMSERL